ncbi:MAG: hypothetical protein GXX85_17420 [Ignavibacteria bacterium]|nr:hypothetical protein [Ignavibacteria bacterium]
MAKEKEGSLVFKNMIKSFENFLKNNEHLKDKFKIHEKKNTGNFTWIRDSVDQIGDINAHYEIQYIASNKNETTRKWRKLEYQG